MILQRLNLDNSWWVEMSNTRLLIDPWLEGEEVDYFRWFNTQRHCTPPLGYADLPAFDAVLITQKYADHFHEQTLLMLNPACILAPLSLQARIVALFPEADVRSFADDSRTHTIGAMSIAQLPTRRRVDPIYDAFVLSDSEECLMVANHGFELDDEHRAQLGAKWSCDVLLSPFNRYSLPRMLGGVVTPGLTGLAALVEQTDPRVVVRTHDELKHATGLVPRLARIEVFDPHEVDAYPWLAHRFLPVLDYTAVTP